MRADSLLILIIYMPTLSTVAAADAVLRSGRMAAALRAASEARLAASDARIATPAGEAALVYRDGAVFHARSEDARSAGIPASYQARIQQAAASRRAARIGRGTDPPAARRCEAQVPAAWSLSANSSQIMVTSPERTVPTTRAPRSPPSTRSDVSRRYYVADVAVPWGTLPPQEHAQEHRSAAESLAAPPMEGAVQHRTPGSSNAAGALAAASAPERRVASSAKTRALAEAEAAADALLRSGSQRSYYGLCEPEQPTRQVVRPPLPKRPSPHPLPPARLAADREGTPAPTGAAGGAYSCGAPVKAHEASRAAATPAVYSCTLDDTTTTLRAQVRQLEHTVVVLRAQIGARDQTVAQLEEELVQSRLPPPPGALAQEDSTSGTSGTYGATAKAEGARGSQDEGEVDSSNDLLDRLAAIKAKWSLSPAAAAPRRPD